MKKIFLVLLVAIMFVGCNEHYHTINKLEKQKDSLITVNNTLQRKLNEIDSICAITNADIKSLEKTQYFIIENNDCDTTITRLYDIAAKQMLSIGYFAFREIDCEFKK